MSDPPDLTPPKKNHIPKPKVGDRVKLCGREETFVVVEFNEKDGYVALVPETEPAPESTRTGSRPLPH
jgi:hypothetical protein